MRVIRELLRAGALVPVLGAVALWCNPVPAGTQCNQQIADYEGFTRGSNPSTPGTELTGRGLVTRLRAPLVGAPDSHEYTWVMGHLISLGSVLADSAYATDYAGGGSSFISIYEDPSFDATPTFYNCPSDIQGADPRYSDGVLYLKGHIVGKYHCTFDVHTASYGYGSFVATVSWDTGSHIDDLPPSDRGGWTFGGTTGTDWACIPKVALGSLADYDQSMRGRNYELCLSARANTWGTLRRMYR